ncbi:MAG: efflux RND transporter periplasmic adaptor subunit [Thermodesulfobacteriota bacterium]
MANTNTLAVSTLIAEQVPEYKITQSYVGEVESARMSRIGFEISGMLEEIAFDEGDSVNKAQVMATLDTDRLKARRAELVATRDQAKANLELAQITRQRTKEALDLNAVSFQEYDEADKSYKAQKASLEQAKSAVKTLDVDIEKSKLKAPFDSVISKRYLDEGEVIQPGQEVFEILERASPEVRIGLATSMIDGIKVGDPIEIKVNGKSYDSKVKTVLPIRGQNTRTVDVILSVENDFKDIRQGDIASVNIEKLVSKNGFWLPLTALTESSRGLWSCYVAIPLGDVDSVKGATHRLERRELELLHQEFEMVYVQGTISDGDIIVSEGIQRLVPDLLVKINNSTSASGGAE